MTRNEIEHALDSGMVEVEMNSGRWWKLRRNGKTKTWKTRPDEFSIPVKAGLRYYGYITHKNINSDHFRIKVLGEKKTNADPEDDYADRAAWKAHR